MLFAGLFLQISGVFLVVVVIVGFASASTAMHKLGVCALVLGFLLVAWRLVRAIAVRRWAVFTAYLSSDGSNWTDFLHKTVIMSTTATAGSSSFPAGRCARQSDLRQSISRGELPARTETLQAAVRQGRLTRHHLHSSSPEATRRWRTYMSPTGDHGYPPSTLDATGIGSCVPAHEPDVRTVVRSVDVVDDTKTVFRVNRHISLRAGR